MDAQEAHRVRHRPLQLRRRIGAGVAEAPTEYRSERYGFRLSYPADLFAVKSTAEAGDGQVFMATDAWLKRQTHQG